jgi:hypothetical protein
VMSHKGTPNVLGKHDASIFGVKMITIKMHLHCAGRMIWNVVTLSWGMEREVTLPLTLLASYWLFAWITFQPCRWRQYIPLRLQ